MKRRARPKVRHFAPSTKARLTCRTLRLACCSEWVRASHRRQARAGGQRSMSAWGPNPPPHPSSKLLKPVLDRNQCYHSHEHSSQRHLNVNMVDSVTKLLPFTSWPLPKIRNTGGMIQALSPRCRVCAEALSGFYFKPQ